MKCVVFYKYICPFIMHMFVHQAAVHTCINMKVYSMWMYMCTCQIQIPKANPLNPLQTQSVSGRSSWDTYFTLAQSQRANVTFGFLLFGTVSDTLHMCKNKFSCLYTKYIGIMYGIQPVDCIDVVIPKNNDNKELARIA